MASATFAATLELAQQLPPEEQDQLIQELQEARQLAAEDAAWDAAVARSQDKLELAAVRVRANRAAGRRIILVTERP